MQLFNKTVHFQFFETVTIDIISVFIKDVLCCHVGLSWMIETKEQYIFTVKEDFIDWCTGVSWFNETICLNLHVPVSEELFFTASKDIYDLMCGLHAYNK